tara:strand:+ start:2311 stop:3285 length:975 start_codon:yes stop_codon:yes gene_type:complete
MKKILVFSNGEKLGDGIIKLPFIYDLKKNFYNSQIYWLTNGYTVYKTVLNSFVKNKLDFVYDNSNINYLPFVKLSNKYQLDHIKFDLIIDTQKTFLKTLTLKKLKTKYFVSNSTNNLLSNIRRNQNFPYKKDVYYVENLYSLLELFLNKKIEERSKIEVPNKILSEVSKIFNPQKKYFGIAPGAGEKNKIWSYHKYFKIIDLLKNRGFEPCFFFGPDDDLIRNKFLDYYGDLFEPEKLLSEIINIQCIMACTYYLEFALSNDSGVSHILSTAQCYLFKLFNDKKPSKFNLVNQKIKSISPNYGESINDISVKTVFEEINKIIND